jgi:hypothetical protein
MKTGRILGGVLLAAALAWPAAAQEKMGAQKTEPKSVGSAQVSTITATVTAIDTAKRQLTVKDAQGNVDTIDVPDSVKRFSEIKVGDQITIRYTEALLMQVKKADQAAKLGTVTDSGIERMKTDKPAAVVSQTTTATVEVEAVDTAMPSITVRTASGDLHTFHPSDAKNIADVKKGDRIVITYKEALAMSVTAPPPAAAK